MWRGVPRRATMVLGDAAGPVSQLTPEHRYRPGTSHGVSLRPRRTRVKRYLGRDREPSYASTRRRSPAIPAIHGYGPRQQGLRAADVWGHGVPVSHFLHDGCEPYFLNYRSTSRRSRARCQRIRAIIWPNFARALAHLDLNADGFGRGLVLPPDQRPEIARVSGATGSIGRQPCRPWSPSRLMLVVFSRTSCTHWRFGEPTSSEQPALAIYRGPASAIGPSRATTAPAPAYSSAAVPETNVGRASHQFTHRRSIHLA